MKKILIYDDDEQFLGLMRETIVKVPLLLRDFEVKSLSEQDFQDTLAVLSDRQLEFRKSGTWNVGAIPFDEASILIIDYDLVASRARSFLTAEIVAYYARCFSDCSLIVGVNQYGENPFDLTLQGHPESFADLNVGWLQLGNPGLWGGNGPGFRPWHWPMLQDYQEAFELKVAAVEQAQRDNVPICEVLGFPAAAFGSLPRTISQFIGKGPESMTFQEFVLKSGNGLRRKDAAAPDVSSRAIARVGAARISKWLERQVLPGQDILVDAPHLITRFPSLLGEGISDIAAWNRTAQLADHDRLGLVEEQIESSRLNPSHWLSRPVWFWQQIRETESIPEVHEPWTAASPDWVFCEDMSQFWPREECREFVAKVDSPFSRRFVRFFPDVQYAPANRFFL